MPRIAAPWPESPDDKNWSSPEVSSKILGEVSAGRGKPIPRQWAVVCARRIRQLRRELQGLFVGFEIAGRKDHLLNWLLACLVARENALLLGAPGVAKTEIAESIFRLLGLRVPRASLDIDLSHAGSGKFQQWWNERTEHERQSQKYFRYLLSRFTQPDELFGPIEITLLRQGILAHINFGLLTGPGVRAAFLDEVFKASSSILNSLLTLTQEREYFNLGGMVKSDLVMFIGASNELPGGMATGTYGIGSGGEDFNLLYAFLDRFPVRIEVPGASGSNAQNDFEKSDLARASELALSRESRRFTTFDSYAPTIWEHGSPSINDVLLLGRCCLEQETQSGGGLFDPKALKEFKTAFLRIGASLQSGQTEAASSRITWTISPRKLKALYKIALAHALVCDDGFQNETQCVNGPGEADLHVFDFIWDSPVAREELQSEVETNIEHFWVDRRRRH
jgi:MoxR-like ATPase